MNDPGVSELHAALIACAETLFREGLSFWRGHRMRKSIRRWNTGTWGKQR